MKKVNDIYVLSETDKKRIAAHARAIAKSRYGNYSGAIDAYFDATTGETHYYEFVGNGYVDCPGLTLVYSAPVYACDF